MKRRKTRFSPGGDVAPGDGVQYFDEDELAAAKDRDLKTQIKDLQEAESGENDETRRNFLAGDYYLESKPYMPKGRPRVPDAPKAPPIKDVPGSGRGGIGGPRVGEREAYMASKRPTVGDIRKADAAAEQRFMDERQRRLSNPRADAIESVYPEEYLLGGGAGASLKALHSAAKGLAPYSAKQIATGAKEGVEAAAKYGPKAGLQVAQSTMKGMQGRSGIQASRAARQKAEAETRQRAEAEAMEKAKPILQARRSNKAERAGITRREDAGMEFSKGGSASRRADGCAVRGKTRGKVY